MATADSKRLPFHLTGAFAPVAEERTDSELEVEGAIPGELCGIYVRNGPNPRSAASPAWFAGEGMLHAVRLEGGRARWYKNRWIDGRGPNTSVICHAGHVLALVETRLPVEVSPELDTRGVFDFEGGVVRSMTAHPKRCARTGELLFFSYAAAPPLLTYYRADTSGRIVHRADLDVTFATYMHDFAITEHYALFYVLPVLLGDFRSPVPIRWADDMPARIALVPRDGGTDDLRWFDVAPGTISHTVNAFEDGDSVVLDAVRAPRILQAHVLYRYRLDLRTGLASESALDPRFLDFPRVSPAVVGRRQRYAYTTELDGFTSDGGFTRTRVHQYDFELRSSRSHDFGAAAMPGECVIVPKCASTAEDDAWVMLFVHGRDGSSTDFVILDAARFDAPPVARVRLPCRVPFGLHGEWIDDTRRESGNRRGIWGDQAPPSTVGALPTVAARAIPVGDGRPLDALVARGIDDARRVRHRHAGLRVEPEIAGAVAEHGPLGACGVGQDDLHARSTAAVVRFVLGTHHCPSHGIERRVDRIVRRRVTSNAAAPGIHQWAILVRVGPDLSRRADGRWDVLKVTAGLARRAEHTCRGSPHAERQAMPRDPTRCCIQQAMENLGAHFSPPGDVRRGPHREGIRLAIRSGAGGCKPLRRTKLR